MEFIINFLGEFTPTIIKASEGNVWFFVPDMFWIFKALLLLIIALYTVKSIFTLMRMY